MVRMAAAGALPMPPPTLGASWSTYLGRLAQRWTSSPFTMSVLMGQNSFDDPNFL